ISDGVVQVKGTPQAAIPLKTVAVLANPLRYAFDAETQRATQFAVGGSLDKPPVDEDDEPGLEATDYYSPLRSTFANGMHAAIVETDPETADIKILRYCVVHDCGPLINPRIVAGQVHGGVAQGVGGALYERLVYDEHGQLLEQVGPDAYRATVTAGVAAIRGTFSGDVRLSDQDAPHSFVLHAAGSGAPGTVTADVKVRLADGGDGTTVLSYDADAVVGGMVGGVGQRVLAGVAKKTAGEFLAAVDDVLNGRAPAARGADATSVVASEPTSWVAPAGAATTGRPDFVLGMTVGALAA